MNKHLLTYLLFTLLVCTANHAQITFDFTAGSFDGTTWTQTVEGVTCTVTYDNDGSGMTVAQLTDNDITSFVSELGLYMGRYVSPPDSGSRTGFARPGVRITFSQDVRLKSYTLGKDPFTPKFYNSYCYFAGGNVTALAGHSGTEGYAGERAFDLESLVPANTTLKASVNSNSDTYLQWLIKTLTVELEPYVEAVIPIPPGNETGITRVEMVYDNAHKHSYALKNGRLHRWTTFTQRLPLSRDFVFDGGQSGVLDFWVTFSDEHILLLETVEGYVLLHKTDDGFNIANLNGNLPHDADQISISNANDSAFAMALKDGFIYFDGEGADEFVTNMPAELSTGGVSQIAAGSHTAMAVKDGQFYIWVLASNGAGLVVKDKVPAEVENGDILHLDAVDASAVVQLTTGELIAFGYASRENKAFAESHTSGELFADLRLRGDYIIAIRADGSILTQDALVSGWTRRSNYDGGAFYEGDDFKLKGLETFPTIVQQLGYEQITFGRENAMALLPGGRIVIWGGVSVTRTGPTDGTSGGAIAIQADAVPAQINEILFPQNYPFWGSGSPINQNISDPGELQMLQAGALGIQWGGDGTPQFEVQTTTDINDASSWESLPVGTDPELRFYRIREITQDIQ